MKKLLIASVSVLALSAGAALAQTSDQTLYQNGTSNSATINQTNDGTSTNTSDVYQGHSNFGYAAYNSAASVSQVTGKSGTTGSKIIQYDGYQRATVNQNNSVGGQQSSSITQSNYSNNATVTQITSNNWDIQGSTVTQRARVIMHLLLTH